MSVARLTEPMKAQVFDGRRTLLPVVEVTLRRGNVVGYPLRGLVDSGATWTLARMSVARHAGLDPAEVRRSPDVVRFAGAAGPEQSAFGQVLDLELGGSPRGRIEVQGVMVFFSDAPLAHYDMLLGQYGLLDRLTFAQIAHAPRPHFVLQLP